MWSFSEMSLPSATFIGAIANWCLLASLVTGLVSTFVIVKTTDVKEAYWDRDREVARDRIVELSHQSEIAKAELGKASAEIADAKRQAADLDKQAAAAKERTAALEKETAQAKLEQEKLKAQLAWRILPADVAQRLQQELAKAPGSVNIKHISNDTEALYLAIQIGNIFSQAKWKVAMTSVTIPGTVVFGVWVPNVADALESVEAARSAFSSANIGFSADTPPPEGMGFGSSLGQAATVLIGSKPVP